MDSISSDIKKGNIKNVYLFYGEDSYKRKVYKEALKKALYSNEMNYAYFEGSGINWQKVYDAAVAVPFFAEKRLVIIENSDRFKKAPAASSGADDEILSLIGSIPTTTCLAFFEREAAKNRKIYKEIARAGAVCECSHDNEGTVCAWLLKGFAQAGKKISREAAYYLIECVGTDYAQLKTEFEKIAAYAADKDTVTKEDIDAVTGRSESAKVYEIINACSQKNPSLMLEKYYALVESDIHPLIILASLRSQFELMLQIGELCNKGYSDREIASQTGKAEFIIRNNKKMISNFRLKQIEEIIEDIAMTDKMIKDGDINERIGVELLLAKISA